MNFSYINSFSNTGGGSGSSTGGTTGQVLFSTGTGSATTDPKISGDLAGSLSFIKNLASSHTTIDNTGVDIWQGTDSFSDSFTVNIAQIGTGVIAASKSGGTGIGMLFNGANGVIDAAAPAYYTRPLNSNSFVTLQTVKNYIGTSTAGTLGTAGMVPFLQSATQGTGNYRLKWDTVNSKLVVANGNSGTASMTESVFGINVLGAQTALGSGYINLQSNGGLNLNGISIIAGNGLNVSNSYTPTSANHIPLLSAVQAYVGTRVNNPSSIPSAGNNYTIALTDTNGIIEGNAATPMTIFIPTNAATAIPLYSRILIVQYGAGAVTIQGSAGVTLNGVLAGSVVTSAVYQSFTLYKRGTDNWIATN